MKNKPLGCLGGSGIIGGLITAAAILIMFAFSDGAMFSPGKLNAIEGELPKDGVLSHADLVSECAACHTAFWDEQRMQDRCLVCHVEVETELTDPGSMHTSFVASNTCRLCHPEHRGVAAPLTDFYLVDFAHDSVGFSLQSHRIEMANHQVDCRSCHPQSVRRFDVEDCQRCHLQIDEVGMRLHIANFASTCIGCHDGVDRYGADFDHETTRYPLQGKHLEVACVDCHENATSVSDLQAAPHECVACHLEADIHEGRLGSNCAQCHTPSDWNTATIDHALTGFPLIGAHAELTCQSCHVANQWTGLETTCYGCHAEQDEHDGRYGTRCEACHQETAWSDVTFDHNLSAFPLTGAHATLSCESCHLDAEFTPLPTACAACHTDPAYHAGLFSADCSACHSTSAWRPASFNLPHSFPLGHGGGAACSTCHPNSLSAYTCYGCHEHNRDRVIAQHQEEGISNISNCLRCHPGGREAGDD
jgi:hypothetical protein